VKRTLGAKERFRTSGYNFFASVAKESTFINGIAF
jgi:hypothetical protein